MQTVYETIFRTPAPFDDILLSSDGKYLTGLSFRNSPSGDAPAPVSFPRTPEPPVLRETRHWLSLYFSGRDPGFLPRFRLENATPFREKVLRALLDIPFGTLTTYGAIAKRLAPDRDGRMSARAVGGAVGWNPIPLILPCHRVIGADGSLTGYGGGLRNKIALLALEGHAACRFP